MNAKRTIEEVEAEIASVKAELENVHGTETEVYARIVGYYRAVRNWNKGKRDEYNNRKLFVYDNEYTDSRASNGNAMHTAKIEEAVKEAVIKAENAAGTQMSYEFFMRQTCPNCPPVKAFMAEVDLNGRIIDVDTDEGLKEAASKGVFSAPTVIFYDENSNEIGRGHNVEELKAVMNIQTVTA